MKNNLGIKGKENLNFLGFPHYWSGVPLPLFVGKSQGTQRSAQLPSPFYIWCASLQAVSPLCHIWIMEALSKYDKCRSPVKFMVDCEPNPCPHPTWSFPSKVTGMMKSWSLSQQLLLHRHLGRLSLSSPTCLGMLRGICSSQGPSLAKVSKCTPPWAARDTGLMRDSCSCRKTTFPHCPSTPASATGGKCTENEKKPLTALLFPSTSTYWGHYLLQLYIIFVVFLWRTINMQAFPP